LYDELYEVWKKEKETSEIQGLPKNFYAKIADYIKKMKEENRMLDRKTMKAKLLDHEFKNVKIMVAELFQIRYKKLREKALARETVAKNVLTKEEEKLCREVLTLTEAYQAFSKDVLRGQLASIEKEAKQTVVVLRFIQKIPALVGADMKTYGPLSKVRRWKWMQNSLRVLVGRGVEL
jgi:DNA replication initiation complex subunit (GINS family)